MKRLILIFGLIFVIGVANTQPIHKHNKNPHYFEYKGKPLVLVASSEHYGAVINEEFNYKLYLETLHKIGLNHTRIFLGDYVESENAFCIEKNTLAVAPGKFLSPWMRSNDPGYILGGNKFNLDKWNPDFFERLTSFMEIANENGIIVEAVLFFSGYLFENSPLHFSNNVNGTDQIKTEQYMTLNNGNILERQKNYCLKLIETLNRFDNVIFNIANEPWFLNQEHPGFSSPPPKATKEWILEVSKWIIERESSLPKQHILSIDYCNEGEIIPLEDVESYFKYISVFNHHYDRDAKSVMLNYDRLPRILSFNETGLMDPFTNEYRIQGWKYFMCGGSLYNNLDFTFQVGSEDGTGNSHFTCRPSGYYGCTNYNTKFELASLSHFWDSLDFVHMKPAPQNLLLKYGHFETFAFTKDDLTSQVVYFIGQGIPSATIMAYPGDWKISWYNTRNLQMLENGITSTSTNSLRVIGPYCQDDIVVKIEFKP